VSQRLNRQIAAGIPGHARFRAKSRVQRPCALTPQDDALIAELTSPIYGFTSTGKMVVESKADMKKRGMRCADLADAFLLTFACGAYRRPKVRTHSSWAA
jgi:hypothetical protein